MRKLILGLSLAALFASGARADFTGKDATGATITFKNSGTCTAVICVSQHQPVDSTGAAFGVTGNPFFISFATGVTLPAYASTPTFNLGTLNGAATAANQSSQITQETAINTVLGTTADTAWVSGSGSAISILKNIAGGVSGPIPAGTSLIGKVGIDQTTPNTTNAISVAQIAGTTTATGSGAMNGGTQRMAIASDSPGIITLGPAAAASSVPVVMTPYPSGATPITASATGTTAATTATLAGTSGKTTYICSMSIRSNATAAATGNATVTGTITGTLNFTHWTAPLASGIGLTEMIFNPCVPASTTNTGIAVISPAPGTGGVVSSTASGYQL